ncbi:MAG: hypothetical protein OQJ77_01580 [Thiovulaceae bacterium]|nr:hypothetical protein [Sulfurimonadaceae bacterium]MCW9025981.1 hypothetical protein [Sulfurimonadaceae bacterium]
MKTVYILLFFLFISGCSSKNAFYNFDMDKHQQLSAQSFKRIKLTNGEEVIGTFSSIYLNEVYPDRYNNNEYFFVYVYLKDSTKKYNIKLNSNDSLKIKELYYDNRFSRLISERSKWNRYYLISYEKVEDLLNLQLFVDKSALASIKYQKNTQ